MQAPVRATALSVSEFNRQVKHLLEVSFMQVWIEGELSGFSRPGSGHWYFTLKDSQAQVRCAMFKGRNQSVRLLPKEGERVLVRAKVSLFEGRGDFQLLIESLEPAGLGNLQRAFDELKHRLQAEGLFDAARKRKLPALPRHIGVVTSPTGAAIHDILTVLQRRFPAIPVSLFPASVQGQSAASEIVRAIDNANHLSDCDLLIVGRGGGSLEDLWPFNEEVVARAIAASRIPVISAVGHEIDITIADLVADLRAPTPSAAAETAVPDGRAWLHNCQQLEERLSLAMQRRLRQWQTLSSQLQARLRDPQRQLYEQMQRLDDLDNRLNAAMQRRMQGFCSLESSLQQRLSIQNPQSRMTDTAQHLVLLQNRLHGSLARALEKHQHRLILAVQTLDVVSPLATLARGYAIVSSDQLPVLRRARDVEPGNQISARLADGTIYCTVDRISPEHGRFPPTIQGQDSN